MKIKTYFVYEYHEFDELVKEKLGIKDYECVSIEEWNNGSSYIFDNINKKDYESKSFIEYDLPQVERAINGNRTSRRNLWATQLLTYMVGKDILPEGNYIITVCW